MLLLVAIAVLYRLFYVVPAAPPPKVIQGNLLAKWHA